MPGLRRRRRRCALAVVAAVLVASCSGSDDPGVERSADGSSSTPPTDSSTTADEEPSTTSASIATADPVENLRLALPGVDSLDPVAASPASIADVVLADLLYDTLTRVDEAGRAVPGLATFAANADRTVWRFTLTEGATFADGSAITAEDVVYSLQRIVDQGEASLASLRIETIESITAVDPSVVDIALRAPSAVLPEQLSSPLYAVTDDATIAGYLAGGDQTPNASGDYAVTIDQTRKLRLERRQGSGPLQIEIGLFEEEGAALDSFLAEEVDWTLVPADRMGEALAVAGNDGLAPFQGELLLGLDRDVAPLDVDPLRRAISLAIDRRALADAVFGATAAPLAGVLPAGVPGGDGECRGPCGPRPDEARALMAEAFPEGLDRPLRLLVDDSAAQRSVAGVIEEQLGAVGIAIEVDSLEAATYQQLIASGQQQLFLFGWVGVARTPASYLPPLFSSSSPDNVVDFADDAIDLQLAAATAQPIATERAKAWRDIETAILERVPVVPLVQFRTVAASRPTVTGIVLGADGTIDVSAVAIAAADGD